MTLPPHSITVTPHSQPVSLDASMAQLVERFNSQLEDPPGSRQRRAVVFPEDSPDEIKYSNVLAVAGQSRLPRQQPPILGGTVTLRGPRRPNFSLNSVGASFLPKG